MYVKPSTFHHAQDVKEASYTLSPEPLQNLQNPSRDFSLFFADLFVCWREAPLFGSKYPPTVLQVSSLKRRHPSKMWIAAI